MMMSYLPADLVEEILSKVPATSLKRLRSTCKEWNALFKNKGFTEKHFRKAAKQSMVLLLNNNRVCSLNVNLNVARPSVEFNSELSLKDSHYTLELKVDIDIVFHCDGLLLCNTKDNRLVVWNPCLGETRWIQLETDYKKYSSTFSLGYINNNKSCRSYKILRCRDSYKLNHLVFKYEVYEFSTDSWRGLDNVSLDYFIKGETCVSLKGNTYWLTLFEEIHFLFCFDYTTDRFKPLSLPPIQNFRHMFLLVVREEQLSVLNLNDHSALMEIWMAKNIEPEATLSWRKSFTVDIEKRDITYVIPNYHSFLIDEEKRLVVGCYMSSFNNNVEIFAEDDKYYKSYSFSKLGSCSRSRPYIFNYVPSLVQIQREVEEAKEK